VLSCRIEGFDYLGLEEMMQSLTPKQRNGALYYDLLNSNGTTHLSSCVFNESEKYVLPDSTFSIQAVTNSWKYGEELQFVSWSRKPPVLEKRAKDDSLYYRFEAGYMPLTHESADQLRRVADQIDNILYYSEPSVTFKGKVITEKSSLAEMLL
jgi:hypothetical protein